ncbi:MAG: hypothetical protein V5A34_10190 [Halapricum sp.]|jgi:hypothetical protein
MVEITLLEVHLDDATVDADATADATTDAVTALPFGSVVVGDEDDTDESEEGSPEEDSGSFTPIALLVGFAVAAFVAWKLLGEDGE